MRPEEIEKLLGGYATGTLTEQERDLLFRAALENQELFNALADEQALKELLDDPDSRRQLLNALGEKKQPLLERFRTWLGRPAAWAVAGSMAAAVLVAVVAVRVHGPTAAPQAELQMAKRTAPAPEEFAVETAPPQPEPLKDKAQPAMPPAVPPAREAEEPAVLAEVTTPAPAPLPRAQAERAGEAAGRPEAPVQIAEVRTRAEVTDESKESARQLYYMGQERGAAATAFRASEKEAAADVSRPPVRAKTAAEPMAEADIVAEAAPRAIGVRYSILRSDAGGEYQEVDPQTVFRPGDSIRLTLEPNENGYLSVTLRDNTGTRKRLFDDRVRAGTRYSIPQADPIKLEGPGGELNLLVVLSRKPSSRPDTLFRNVRSDVEGRKLLTERISGAAPGKPKEEAVYVVDPRAEPNARVVLEIPIVYR